MTGVGAYVLRVFVAPNRVFPRLFADGRRMRIGVGSMVVMSLLYTLVSVFLAILHGTPNPPPFLRIPSEQYFFWASFFYAPVLFLGMVLASAVMHLVGRALGGRGQFEDTFALTAFATATATLPALLPDLALTFVQVIGLMDYEPWFYSVTHGGLWFYLVWVYLLAYIACFCVFYPAVVGSVLGLSRPRAIITGVLGFIIYQGFIFVFIR